MKTLKWDPIWIRYIEIALSVFMTIEILLGNWDKAAVNGILIVMFKLDRIAEKVKA